MDARRRHRARLRRVDAPRPRGSTRSGDGAGRGGRGARGARWSDGLPTARTVFVQIDEPLLEPVRRGRVPTASGWAHVPRPRRRRGSRSGLSTVVDCGPRRRCGRRGPHLQRLSRRWNSSSAAGVDALSFDLSHRGTGRPRRAGRRRRGRHGAAARCHRPAGRCRHGAKPQGPGVGGDGYASDACSGSGRPWGSPPVLRWAALTLTPTCGLAGADPRAGARRCSNGSRQVAQALEEDPDGDHRPLRVASRRPSAGRGGRASRRAGGADPRVPLPVLRQGRADRSLTTSTTRSNVSCDRIEAEHPSLITPDSPTQTVGGQVADMFEPVEHLHAPDEPRQRLLGRRAAGLGSPGARGPSATRSSASCAS